MSKKSDSPNEIWIYVWKACRNHNKENPSNSDYILINIENFYGLDAYNALSKKEKSKLWEDYAGDWAERVDQDGYYYGYEYDGEVKTPPKEWLEKKVDSLNRQISAITNEIERVNEYLQKKNE